MNLRLLHRISQRPKRYSGRKRDFWSDPYVSYHVLEAHLDADTDAASRPPEQIEETVRFILGASCGAGLAPEPLSILDLGCGPGLYAERFASAGCRVTGIDLSRRSIEYARERASKLGLQIAYRQEDLLKAKLGGEYDVAVLIYGEFCTFSAKERAALLKRVRRALKPGGMFLFDVFTENYVDRVRTGSDWYVSLKDGFWREGKHLVLEQTFRYPSDSESVVRYTIISETGSFEQFSVWWRHFSVSEITDVVERAGFSVDMVYGSLWGSPVRQDDEWIGVFCRAPEKSRVANATTATMP